jgi:hypothetical protein
MFILPDLSEADATYVTESETIELSFVIVYDLFTVVILPVSKPPVTDWFVMLILNLLPGSRRIAANTQIPVIYQMMNHYTKKGRKA